MTRRLSKTEKLAADKQVIDWLRVFLYICQSCLISAAALQMPPWLVAATGILAMATQYRISLYADSAVDTALAIPVAPPDTDETQPAARFGAGHEGEG